MPRATKGGMVGRAWEVRRGAGELCTRTCLVEGKRLALAHLMNTSKGGKQALKDGQLGAGFEANGWPSRTSPTMTIRPRWISLTCHATWHQGQWGEAGGRRRLPVGMGVQLSLTSRYCPCAPPRALPMPEAEWLASSSLQHSSDSEP